MSEHRKERQRLCRAECSNINQRCPIPVFLPPNSSTMFYSKTKYLCRVPRSVPANFPGCSTGAFRGGVPGWCSGRLSEDVLFNGECGAREVLRRCVPGWCSTDGNNFFSYQVFREVFRKCSGVVFRKAFQRCVFQWRMLFQGVASQMCSTEVFHIFV